MAISRRRRAFQPDGSGKNCTSGWRGWEAASPHGEREHFLVQGYLGCSSAITAYRVRGTGSIGLWSANLSSFSSDAKARRRVSAQQGTQCQETPRPPRKTCPPFLSVQTVSGPPTWPEERLSRSESCITTFLRNSVFPSLLRSAKPVTLSFASVKGRRT